MVNQKLSLWLVGAFFYVVVGVRVLLQFGFDDEDTWAFFALTATGLATIVFWVRVWSRKENAPEHE